jgi:hypothetical protein
VFLRELEGFTPLQSVFLCVVWKADQIGNDLMIVAVLFTVSVPINMFHYQLQVLTFTKVRFYVSLACNI